MLNRIYTIIAAIVIAIGTGLRTWQLAATIDKSGFYLPQYQTLCNTLGYVFLAIIIAFLVIGRLILKPKTTVVFPKKNLVLGGGGILLTAACVLQGILDYSSAQSDSIGSFSFLCCFATALAFGIIGISLLQGKTIPFFAAALPVVSHLGYLILQYANFNGIAKISENLLYILFICAFLAFTLTQCRVFTKIDSAKGIAFGFGTAVATAFFGFCISLPHWIVGIMGQKQFPVSFMGFAAGVYALVYLFELTKLTAKQGE